MRSVRGGRHEPPADTPEPRPASHDAAHDLRDDLGADDARRLWPALKATRLRHLRSCQGRSIRRGRSYRGRPPTTNCVNIPTLPRERCRLAGGTCADRRQQHRQQQGGAGQDRAEAKRAPTRPRQHRRRKNDARDQQHALRGGGAASLIAPGSEAGTQRSRTERSARSEAARSSQICRRVCDRRAPAATVRPTLRQSSRTGSTCSLS